MRPQGSFRHAITALDIADGGGNLVKRHIDMAAEDFLRAQSLINQLADDLRAQAIHQLGRERQAGGQGEELASVIHIAPGQGNAVNDRDNGVVRLGRGLGCGIAMRLLRVRGGMGRRQRSRQGSHGVAGQGKGTQAHTERSFSFLPDQARLYLITEAATFLKQFLFDTEGAKGLETERDKIGGVTRTPPMEVYCLRYMKSMPKQSLP